MRRLDKTSSGAGPFFFFSESFLRDSRLNSRERWNELIVVIEHGGGNVVNVNNSRFRCIPL